jgi:iron(III) transport system permease protein
MPLALRLPAARRHAAGMALTEGDAQFGERFCSWPATASRWPGLTALLAVALALLLAYAARLCTRSWPQGAPAGRAGLCAAGHS